MRIADDQRPILGRRRQGRGQCGDQGDGQAAAMPHSCVCRDGEARDGIGEDGLAVCLMGCHGCSRSILPGLAPGDFDPSLP